MAAAAGVLPSPVVSSKIYTAAMMVVVKSINLFQHSQAPAETRSLEHLSDRSVPCMRPGILSLLVTLLL